MIHLDTRDVAGLTWTARRAGELWGALRRRRKYLHRAAPITPEEAALIESLTAVRDGARAILKACGHTEGRGRMILRKPEQGEETCRKLPQKREPTRER